MEINDNPPGILLALLAATAFVLAFVHPCRTARQFRFLLYTSVLGFALFTILNNFFAAVAHNRATAGTLQNLLQSLAVAAFFLAYLICPAAFIVGAVGLVPCSFATVTSQRESLKQLPNNAGR